MYWVRYGVDVMVGWWWWYGGGGGVMVVGLSELGV
jgi:hypothetical protein